MDRLQVCIEISGKPVLVGYLLYSANREAEFKYSDDYLSSQGAVPISISLSLQAEPFSTGQTRNFFEGLLPEGFTRRAVAQWLRVDEGDYLAILKGLGSECLGAIQIVDDSYKEASHYEQLTLAEVQALANEGATKSAAIMTETHLSLAGASGKVGLYYDEASKNWFLPKGLAPSTHIVKQSHVRLKNIVANEQLALMTAKRLGINVADSFIVNLGAGEDENVLLASKRFDRSFEGSIKAIDSLPYPLRLHQEDFAQALGISSSDKYEKAGENYLSKIFELLRKYSANPLEDRIELWKRLVFNYLIGNTDGHIKNFSLLYSSDLKSIRLAPAYDIVSTTIYKQGTRNLSIYMGNECLVDDITKDTILQSAKQAGVGTKLAEKNFDVMVKGFRKALQQSAKELEKQGFDKATTIADLILESGGIAKYL